MKKYPVSPSLLSNWTDDTPNHHHFVETQIANLINPYVNQFHDDDVPFLVSKGNCPFYDVMFADGGLFEIKITGAERPFIEYMHKGEDSGLAITKAEYYAILSPGFCKKLISMLYFMMKIEM